MIDASQNPYQSPRVDDVVAPRRDDSKKAMERRYALRMWGWVGIGYAALFLPALTLVGGPPPAFVRMLVSIVCVGLALASALMAAAAALQLIKLGGARNVAGAICGLWFGSLYITVFVVQGLAM
ncbi:MAG: hypothetical protein AAGB00_05675 [Planctomycetota bacterium]